MTPRLLEIKKNVLDKNEQLASELRAQFHAAGTFTLNWVSSPGTGKTAWLERTLSVMKERGLSVAALVGDLATENDARRLARSGAPARQIVTDGICHLEAEMVHTHLLASGWALNQLQFLFIENVGNLVCPSGYDLGEDLRVVLLSVTEGEDKPLKYPSLFLTADVALITKIDLAEAVDFNREAAYANLHAVRPGLRIFETSAKSGLGLDAWVNFLIEQRGQRRPA
ncbi:MAG: hydrogenase nickel incorporation protein HypB [Anaerolineales bacterium]|nr:hydrogenase nickel incorporation protein HypB [Anaerolineales bacterium]